MKYLVHFYVILLIYTTVIVGAIRLAVLERVQTEVLHFDIPAADWFT